jgi:2-amino-4-hydroxy-6-hydroxymethyldihydropteridine diphosphokinase
MGGYVAYLGLGSSLGDRMAHLQAAVDLIGQSGSGVRVCAVSSVYESPHMGLEPGDETRYPPHLNAVIQVETMLSPEDLLAVAQRVEEIGGRNRNMRWSPRTIDVDLLLYADMRLRSERLEIPHPGLAQRAFVVLPLLQLEPHLLLPNGTAIASLVNSEAIRSGQIELLGAKLRLPK